MPLPVTSATTSATRDRSPADREGVVEIAAHLAGGLVRGGERPAVDLGEALRQERQLDPPPDRELVLHAGVGGRLDRPGHGELQAPGEQREQGLGDVRSGASIVPTASPR